MSYAQKPILTDEFDRFLVTRETKVGDVIGQIELVFPNPKKITWSLVPPIPGGDRRHYLKEGQLDATKIVTIDPELYDILSFLFPSREEFFKEMGWDKDLEGDR